MVYCPVYSNNNDDDEDNNNKINLRTYYYIDVDNSNRCIKNEHGLCEGIIAGIIDGSKKIKICNCPCHNNMYQLIRNTLAVVNERSTSLDYGFPASDAL
jgi:hypothetical protein